jgi:Flp pilus assembly CpaE family ATPase
MAAAPNHAGWTPLVVCPQPAMAQRILAVLRELAVLPAATLNEYPRMGAIAGIAQQHACDICFLDAASNPEHAQTLIAELSPAVPVVALHTRSDADLILRCLRGGACEFLTDPDAGALRNLFTRLGRVRALAPEPAGGTVYTVIPGKAGSGASTVAAHLAIYVGAIGATVLLVDGDSLSGSVAFLLKLRAEYHLGDVLRDWKRMDQDLWARMTIRSCGIDVLAAPANPAVRIEVTPAAAAGLCVFWRERYQVVVLDMADARAAAETGFLGLSDQVLLVSGNELGSLSATRRAMEYLDQSMGGRSRLRLILNRCSPSRGLKPEDVRSALAQEPYAVLDDDWPALQAAVLEGRPAPMSSRFSMGVEALCRQLRNTGEPGGNGKRNGSWLSLLRHRK